MVTISCSNENLGLSRNFITSCHYYCRHFVLIHIIHIIIIIIITYSISYITAI